MFLSVSEEEPPGDAGVQQLRVCLGQGDQLETLLSTVPTTEKRPLGFISPHGTWQEVDGVVPK